MADIFDTSTSEGRNIQQSIGEPNIAPQGRAAGTNVDSQDLFNLSAGVRVDQLAAQDEARRAAREAQRAKEQANRNLDGLTAGLVNRYTDIDTTVQNPVERNRLKREADLMALQSAGKGNSAYINQIIGRLGTKREARSDGMINVIGSNGEILGVEAGSRDAVLQGRQESHQTEIQEVLPSTLGGITVLLEKDSVQGNHITQGTVSGMMTRLKNESKRMKSISDDFHVNSNQLPASQLPQLTKNATNGYLRSVSGVFGTFTAPDMMKAVRSGDMSRSDIDIAMQQVRRDMIDEITSQGVPVNMQNMEAHISESISNIKDAYDMVQKNDLITLEVAEKQATLKNEIAKQKHIGKYSLNIVAEDKKHLEATTAATAATSTFMQAAQEAELRGDSDAAATFTAAANGSIAMTDSLLEVQQKMTQHRYQSSFDFEDIKRSAINIETREDLEGVVNRLSKVTDHAAGWAMAPHVATMVEGLTPAIVEAFKQDLITEEEVNDLFEQFGQYEAHSLDMARKAGWESEEFTQKSEEQAGFFNVNLGWILPIAALLIPGVRAKAVKTLMSAAKAITKK